MFGKPGSSDLAALPLEECNARWALLQIEEALRHLRFGQVIVTVQDGVVIQVERTERKRFQRAGQS